MNIPKEILRSLGVTKSKYGNKKSTCLSKHMHDSRAEADYCNSLLADKQAKRIGGYRVQQAYRLSAGIVHIVDFEILDFKGHIIEVHDVKGFQTDVWKMKHKLFIEKYTDIKYVVVNRKEQDGRTIEQWHAAHTKRADRKSSVRA